MRFVIIVARAVLPEPGIPLTAIIRRVSWGRVVNFAVGLPVVSLSFENRWLCVYVDVCVCHI